MVAAPGRAWKVYAGPVAFLLAATIAVVVFRVEWHHAPHVRTGTHARSVLKPPTVHPPPRYYVVQAGDTLDAIAARVKVSVKRLRALNPHVSPTALFIGEKIRLR